MIPLRVRIEPANFEQSVRNPGLRFLAKIPNPSDSQWKGKEYWQRSLPDLRNYYNEICSYCATWIPHSTGSHSIDHFIPKAVFPNLAYEWTNFRYVSTRFNSRKGIQVIADPFKMRFYWFSIDFSTFFINPNSLTLGKRQILLAKNTIDILKLNDDDELVKERQVYFDEYKQKHIDLDYLRRKAPFIAYEMERQSLL